VEVIIGNPPFLGGKRLRTGLGDAYVEALFHLYEGRVPPEADLVTYWFEKARGLVESKRAKRVGLLATQSIRAGVNLKALQHIKESGDIFMAWSDRPWVLDGAAVRVSMVGFDDGSAREKMLDGVPVKNINADLSGAIDISGARRLAENCEIAFQGPVKVGPFDIDNQTAKAMLVKPNPNGCPNSDVVRPTINGSDITRRSRQKWTIDFGELDEQSAALYEAPFEYVNANVRLVRERNRDRQRREAWWRLGRSGGDLKKAKSGKQRIVLTPRVAKHRLFAWADAEAVPDTRVYAFARDDDYFFGVLQSSIHETWSLKSCSWHGVGNDPTYNTSTCFDPFPFPWPPGKEPKDDPRVQDIAHAAKELVKNRDTWLNPPGAPATELKKRTLTNLYNQRPQWLEDAHQALDKAVLAAYGWPEDLSDADILERLLALNRERAGACSVGS
jgi:type II restriction/modification system DNA methylase subunit YeeA